MASRRSAGEHAIEMRGIAKARGKDNIDCSRGVENEKQQVRHRSDRNGHVRSTQQEGICDGVLAQVALE
jgi:hypothetical protein